MNQKHEAIQKFIHHINQQLDDKVVVSSLKVLPPVVSVVLETSRENSVVDSDYESAAQIVVQCLESLRINNLKVVQFHGRTKNKSVTWSKSTKLSIPSKINSFKDKVLNLKEKIDFKIDPKTRAPVCPNCRSFNVVCANSIFGSEKDDWMNTSDINWGEDLTNHQKMSNQN